METKKLVVQLTENIKEQKQKAKLNEEIRKEKEKKDLIHKNFGVNEKYISLSKQEKINAIYKLLYENPYLTKQDLEKVLIRRPILFNYYRYLLKKYPNFIYSIKAAGPYYYILREAQDKQNKNANKLL